MTAYQQRFDDMMSTADKKRQSPIMSVSFRAGCDSTNGLSGYFLIVADYAMGESSGYSVGQDADREPGRWWRGLY